MKTRIQLGSSGSIDLFEDIPVSLNFSIADIRNPDKRNASYSKTINIPGSKHNNKIFGHIFEIDIDGSFNPNIKTPAIIYSDEIEQINGYLQLLKINAFGDKITYECTILGTVGNIFTIIGDRYLTDLNLSQYDHQYTKANQKASWTGIRGAGYLYPLIDYGETNGLTYDVNNFYPAIYAKTYIDKIFESAECSYYSNFLDSDFFKNLIVPYNSGHLVLSAVQGGDRYMETQVSNQTVVLSSTNTNPLTTLLQFQSVPATDPSNQWNNATYQGTIAYTGTYSLYGSTDYETTSSNTVTGNYYIYRERAGVITTIGTFFMLGGSTSTTFTMSVLSVGLTAGDKIYAGLEVRNVASGTGNLLVTFSGFTMVVVNSGIVDGGYVGLNDAIPQKIKQKDFLMSIVKCFNLYIQPDKDYSNKYYIEPRNSFYSSGVTVDWTEKLDISKDLEIKPMGELDSRVYKYSYTEDSDYYNALYKLFNKEVYGTRLIDTKNEFIGGTKENTVIFAATPLVGNDLLDRVIPVISAGSLNVPTEFKSYNIRLLYYGGVLTTANPWTYTSYVSGNTSETTYPYVGHLDSVTNPTLDLSFGVPFEVYYTALTYTNNNLYNAYHKQFLDEITDKDSKIVTGWFYLTPVDIYTLDFRNQFYVDGHYLRLNKVMDYDPVKPGLTKCEFIKIKTANTFVPTQVSSNGGVGLPMPSIARPK